MSKSVKEEIINSELSKTSRDLLTGLEELKKSKFKEMFGNCQKISKIGETCSIYRGASPRPISKYITQEENGVNWIKIGDVSDDALFITRTKEKITKEGADKSRYVHKGDFILSNSMSFGRPYILAIDGCVHDGWLVISNYSTSFDSVYLYHALRSDFVQNQFLAKACGSTVKNLNSDLVRDTYISVPDLSLQRKFATFVTQIDKIKETLQLILEKLELLKKSKFKEMFGNPIKNDKKWIIEPLETNVKLINGRAYKQTELLDSGKYKVLRVGNFFSNKSWFYSNLELDNQKYCDSGDLLYAWSASFGAQIWKGEKVIFHYHIWKVEVINKYDKEFLCYLLNDITKYLLCKTHGIAMMHLTKIGMEKMPVIVPPIDEQKKFVAFVTQIDKIKENLQKSLTDLTGEA